MQYARTYKIAVFYIISILFSVDNALAAAIANLDNKPHTMEADGREITIAAGEMWRTPGKVKITYQGRDIYMEDTDEYAIWNDRDFGPQRRLPPGGGNLGN